MSPVEINHFMWGYQQHFRIGQEIAAKSIFKLLDDHFEPEIFLVGILVDDLKGKYPACVEPETDFWIHSESFNSTLQIASDLYKFYPEKEIIHTHPVAQDAHEKWLFRLSIRDTIKKIIDSKNNSASFNSYFVSLPTRVDGYLVCIVLMLQKEIIDSYPALTTSKVASDEWVKTEVNISLIDATIKKYLEKASDELNVPSPGKSFIGGVNAEEIIREAGNSFVTGLAYRSDQSCIEGWHGLYSSCNHIASAFYERSVGKGTFLLAHKLHPAIETIVQFMHPTKLNLTRGARKLLELASHDLAMHTDSENIYGLVKLNEMELDDENIFVINIIDHHHWEVKHADKVLMRVKYGQPYLPKPSFNEEKLRIDLPRLFKKITSDAIDRIVRLVQEAEKEKHGTMLLISRHAKKEAQRLGKQATQIKPKKLSSEILKNLTAIDGALLINPKGKCYAIGVILDGMATEAGDPSRGARYNSAIRYTKTSKAPCLAIVISEDGGIDFIPDLMPAIKKSKIEDTIYRIKEIAKSDSIDQRLYREYNEELKWISAHRFYLLKQHCLEINNIMKIVTEKVRSEGTVSPIIGYDQFVHDPTFDINLYYIHE